MSTFDTVRFSLTPHPWHVSLGSTVPEGWTHHSGYRNQATFQSGAKLYNWMMMAHEVSGLRVGGTRDYAEWVEASLPRLLYGSNGYLLKPADIPAALYALRDKVYQVAPDCQLDELTRADLVQHLQVDRLAALAALHGVCHPKVRSHPREYFGTGLDWVGSTMVIRFYDKRAEQDGIPGDLMRLEFQLRTKALNKSRSLWDGLLLNPENARLQYRDLALQFTPKPVAKPSTLVQFLALLQREDIRLGGRPALDVFLEMKSSPKYQRWLRAKVLSQEVPDFILHLDYLLPHEKWPRLIDCPPLSHADSMVA